MGKIQEWLEFDAGDYRTYILIGRVLHFVSKQTQYEHIIYLYNKIFV